MSSPFRRTLPSTPSLAQQKKQAKELLQSFTAGDPEARDRVRAVLPDKQRIALGDTQFVLAREYGFADWSALRQHIDAIEEQQRSPHERIHAAFRRRDPDAVRNVFFDRAHQPLHELAAETSRHDRATAARLLEAKQAVEADLDSPDRSLDTDLDELLDAASDAIAASRRPAPAAACTASQ